MSKAIAFFNPLTNNNISGIIIFEQLESSLKMQINLQGFKPNHTFAIHIHEFGDLTDGCTSLGAHFNPKHQNHGSDLYTNDHHPGDIMNNLTSNHLGCVQLNYVTPHLSILYSSSKCIVGRSVVIHYYQDDLGQKGSFVDGNLVPYSSMTLKELQEYSAQRKYPKNKNKKQLISKLEEESLKTGNAGGRMACAIIGIMKS
jgi:Cu-Zn family superoxide dismutase